MDDEDILLGAPSIVLAGWQAGQAYIAWKRAKGTDGYKEARKAYRVALNEVKIRERQDALVEQGRSPFEPSAFVTR